jgi:maleate isomerase
MNPNPRVYRIGQIVPSSNTTMETEIPAMLLRREAISGERYTFHSSRMRMHKVTAEELKRMNGEGGRCAAELADARVDVMSTACLVAIMAMGNGYHRAAQAELEAAARANGSDAAVMTSAGALIEGLKLMGARRISLLAPYSDELTRLVVKYIEAEEIEVADSRNFCVTDNLAVGRIDPLGLVDEAAKLSRANVDAIVVSVCVQMPSLPALALTEAKVGVPVTSTSACTVRRMLDLLGLDGRVPDAGALLDGRFSARHE